MWEFVARQLLRQLAKQTGRKLASVTFDDEANGPEVYADRIKRDFHLHDYADAWNLYDSDRDYWEKYYGPVPRIDARKEFIRDSAASAGVPSRNNVFEYDFPSLTPPSTGEAPPAASTNGSPAPNRSDSFDSRFGNWNLSPFGSDAGGSSRQAEAPKAPIRKLSRKIGDPSQAATFERNAPAIPFVPPNQVLSPVRPDTFDGRFGNWTSSADSGSAENPSEPRLVPQATRPLGIVSGQPMPDYPVPPPIFDLSGNTKPRQENSEDWFLHWLRSSGSY